MHLPGKRGDRDEKDQSERAVRQLKEDVEFVRRAEQDPVAAEQLLVRLAPQVRQAVFYMVGGSQEAEDLTHICLVEILENLKSYQGSGALEAWVGRVAYRVVMRHLSRRRREERTVSVVPTEIGVATLDPEYESNRGRLRDILAHHLQKLPENRRMTLVLRLAYQYSVAEVAKTMGVPINTVRDRIRVGLKELRQSLLRDPRAKDFLDADQGGKFNGKDDVYD